MTPNPPFNNMNFIPTGWTDRGSGYLTPVDVGTVGSVLAQGSIPLVSGQDFIDIAFAAQPDTTFVPSTLVVTNVLDSNPPKIFPTGVIQKTQIGMRVALNAAPTTANYVLTWTITQAAS